MPTTNISVLVNVKGCELTDGAERMRRATVRWLSGLLAEGLRYQSPGRTWLVETDLDNSVIDMAEME